jgi:hypothetical protein
MKKESKKWTHKEVEKHIIANLDCSYGAAIVVAALYKKLYGLHPKIGLSGFQGEAVEVVLKVLPNKTKTKRRMKNEGSK